MGRMGKSRQVVRVHRGWNDCILLLGGFTLVLLAQAAWIKCLNVTDAKKQDVESVLKETK